MLNPAYSCLVNRNLEDYFLLRSINLTLIVLRIREALHKRSIPTQPVMPFITPSIYSWKRRNPVVDLQLTEFSGSRGSTDVTPDVFREVAQEQYAECRKIFMDGSNRRGVETAAVSGREIRKVSLPGIASIYVAELHAIRLELDILSSQPHSKYLICSDSLSAILALQNSKIKIH